MYSDSGVGDAAVGAGLGIDLGSAGSDFGAGAGDGCDANNGDGA